MIGQPAVPPRHRFAVALILVTVFAWMLREYFILATIIDSPIRGDVRDYVSYAWNLIHHGVFSQSWPGPATPVPDAFRGPGYPFFVAAWMWLDPTRWYALCLHAQAAAGALTAALTTLLARHWLSQWWAILAGVLVAVWPHHIAATGALLTEVWFGFLLVLALYLSAEAMSRRSLSFAISSGIAFSLGSLTSLITLPFPLFMAALYWRERLPKAGLAFLIFAMLSPALWGLRDVPDQAPAAPGRVEMNLVQGSWPEYHQAYIYRHAEPAAEAIMATIGSEEQLLAADRPAGLQRLADRMSRDPLHYSKWYLLEKPYLLWDWDIRMGAGDVYFHPPNHSPLETNEFLRVLKLGLELLNPAIFVLTAATSLTFLFGLLLRASWATPTAVSVAGFCVFVTVVHVIFQAEPRYSIAYRPMQITVLVTACWALVRLVRYGRKRANN